MKELKITNGKFTLEGKVVEAEPTRLTTVECFGIPEDLCYGLSKKLESNIVGQAEKEENAYVIVEGIDVRGYWDRSYYPVLYLKIKER